MKRFSYVWTSKKQPYIFRNLFIIVFFYGPLKVSMFEQTQNCVLRFHYLNWPVSSKILQNWSPNEITTKLVLLNLLLQLSAHTLTLWLAMQTRSFYFFNNTINLFLSLVLKFSDYVIK